MTHLQQLLSKRRRIVAGAISGTSVDAIEAVIARLEGSGTDLRIEVLGHAHWPIEPAIRSLVLANSAETGSSARSISQLNAALPILFADAIDAALKDAGLSRDALDLVGCHGQTIHHVPDNDSVGSLSVRSTLQIGDPSVLAVLVGKPVVGDFRTPDMVLGGQGAPLVPYLDFVAFRDDDESRIMLNLGGIANVTFLPAACKSSDVVAFDTGPANMVIDALAQRFFGLPFDDAGSIAATGRPHVGVLAELLDDSYFRLQPPKSTGRERYGASYVEALCTRFAEEFGPESSWDDAQKATALSTATALTAESVSGGIDLFKDRGSGPIGRVIASGGGTFNLTLMQMLADRLDPVPIERIDDHGIKSEEKEALCFAVMAHELLNGVPTALPSVTGAERPALLGKICLPS